MLKSDPMYAAFIRKTLLSVILLAAIVMFIADTERALCTGAGGVYCMVSIWSWHLAAVRTPPKSGKRDIALYWIILLKAGLFGVLLWALLKSPVAAQAGWVLCGVLAFIPGSLWAAFTGRRPDAAQTVPE